MMKCTIGILLLLCVGVRAATLPDDLFLSAKNAYDQGLYAVAEQHYQSMLASGIRNAEVYFNLGNAYYKDDKLPLALQYYRSAWYLAPQDSEIRNNLDFVMDAVGSARPLTSWVDRLFQSLSKAQWITAAVVSYVLLSLFVALALLHLRGRFFWLKLAAIPAVLLFCSAAGWWHWRGFDRQPEWVAVANATVLHGPLKTAHAFYTVPAGALLRQTSIQGDWVEVLYDNKVGGWISKDDIQCLCP